MTELARASVRYTYHSFRRAEPAKRCVALLILAMPALLLYARLVPPPTVADVGMAHYAAQAYIGAQTVPFEALYRAAGQANGIDWRILAAQGSVESAGWDPYYVYGPGVSDAGAMGVAQFMPDTWAEWGYGSPWAPADAISAQGRFMAHLYGVMREAGKGPEAMSWALLGYLHGAAGALEYPSLDAFPDDSRGYLMDIVSMASQW